MAHRGENGIIKYHLIQNKQEGEKKEIWNRYDLPPPKDNPTTVNGRFKPRHICNHMKCK